MLCTELTFKTRIYHENEVMIHKIKLQTSETEIATHQAEKENIEDEIKILQEENEFN